MLKYFLKRVGFAILALFVLLVLVFFLMQAMPGFPILRDNKDTDITYLEKVRSAGLLDNIFVQFGRFIEEIFTKGRFGQIYTSNESVWERMSQPMIYTLIIAGPAFIISSVIGILFGIVSAYYRGRWPDILINGISVLFISIPSFIFALYLIQLAGVVGLPTQFVIYNGENISNVILSAIIPVLSMTLASVSTITYYTRNELVEVFKQDYIKVALAKGYTFRQVVFKYALRNAGIPILAALLPSFLTILTGSIVIEKFFNVPGTASILIDSINSKEFYLVIFSAVFYGAIYFILQIIVDVSYSFIDPRVTLAENNANSIYARLKSSYIRKNTLGIFTDQNKFMKYFSNKHFDALENDDVEPSATAIINEKTTIAPVNLNYQKIIIHNSVEEIPEVSSALFKPVDIYGVSSEQLAGKPTRYITDVFKRFFKSKAATFFTVLLGIILIVGIIISLTSFNTVANPFTDILPSTMIAYLPIRIPWLGIDGIADTVIDADTFNALKQYEYLGIWKGFEQVGSQYKIIAFNPYVIPGLENTNLFWGTDGLGRDWSTMLWYSTIVSFVFALIVSIPSVILGTIYGAIAGSNAGKWSDTLLMRIVEILSGVPLILWIMIIGIALSGQSLSLLIVGVSLILVNWMGPAVTARTYILKYKDAEFVQAARTLGASQTRIIFRHMLPNISGRLFVRLVNMIPRIIFFEASLVFLGLKSPTEISLGTMIETARTTQYIHLLLAPTLMMVLLTLSSQIIANNLNDSLDPRVSGD